MLIKTRMKRNYNIPASYGDDGDNSYQQSTFRRYRENKENLNSDFDVLQRQLLSVEYPHQQQQQTLTVETMNQVNTQYEDDNDIDDNSFYF